MPFSPTSRQVQLIDGRTVGGYVQAILLTDATASCLVEVERSWKSARERAALALSQAGISFEHSDWDWQNKIETVESGKHRIVAVESESLVQGLLAALALPRSSAILPGGDPILYVDYLEVAPWNLKGQPTKPQFVGVGSLLIASSVLLSLEAGWGGRIGLHSLPTAERFYQESCQMTRIGPDPNYFDLVYFEFNDVQASALMTKAGLSR